MGKPQSYFLSNPSTLAFYLCHPNILPFYFFFGFGTYFFPIFLLHAYSLPSLMPTLGVPRTPRSFGRLLQFPCQKYFFPSFKLALQDSLSSQPNPKNPKGMGLFLAPLLNPMPIRKLVLILSFLNWHTN